MFHKIKKIFLIIMAAALVFVSDMQTVKAADSTYTWTFVDGVLTFTGTGKITEDFYKEIPQEDIKKVIIGEGITEIEIGCFVYCYNMEEVIFPESLKKIGTQAFDECYALKEVTIPAGLEELSGGAFLHCDSLEKITILCDGKALSEMAFSVTTTTEKETLVYVDESYLANWSQAMFRGRKVYLNIETGDVNGDKAINAKDALEMLKVSANMIEESFLMSKMGDMDGDSAIDANDALAVLKYVAGV